MVTMSDIAARAGVSQTTVSFVLNGRSNGAKITEATRQRVLETAQAMGYRRNELARAMVTGKSRVLGLLTYDTSTEHIATIVAGALDEAAFSGYSTKVLHIPYNGTRDEQIEVLHRCSSWRLDGTMAISLRQDFLELLSAEMKKTNFPVAYIENILEGENAIHVTTNPYSGIRAAIEHLFILGHRHIGFMSGPEAVHFTRSRNETFLNVLKEFELPIRKNSLVAGHWSDISLIQKAVVELLDVPERVSAVICPGDAAAMATIREARRRGLSLPGDLSVIGFGDSNLGRYADPALSSISQPFREMGKTATRRLLEYIDNDKSVTVEIPPIDMLPTSLVVRDSTARFSGKKTSFSERSIRTS